VDQERDLGVIVTSNVNQLVMCKICINGNESDWYGTEGLHEVVHTRL